MTIDWRTLGAPPPSALRDARLQLHWAAQVISATADLWIPERADDGHTNMAWHRGLGALVGRATGGGVRLALRVAELELVALRAEGPEARFPLAGQTLEEAMRWADRQAAAAEDEKPRGIHARDYAMPDHDVRTGAPFTADAAALAELARWCDDGAALLEEIVAGHPAALPVRAWPHHFDFGSIASPGEGVQLGFGLSLGDHFYEEPYFYLTIHPLHRLPPYPPLGGGGVWRTDPPFIGAVLVGSALVDGADAAAQLTRARAYFTSAFAAAGELTAEA